MSSIYRKGRDGYFYYQAYVYNSKTKKKDKRIFHSLGTKKRKKALIKQKEYDLKYEKKDEHKYNLVEHFYLRYNPKIVLRFSLGIGIIIIINHYFIDNYGNSNVIKDNKELTEKKIRKNIGTIMSEQTKLNRDIRILNNKEENHIVEQQLIESGNENIELEPSKNIIVNYKIERVEVLSGVFNQGKIYITTESESSDEQLLFLCNKVRERYDEFSNIIICIYSDDSNGLMIAKGMDININNSERNKAWLAMYSFNPVEGEYFDNNPSGYLGLY